MKIEIRKVDTKRGVVQITCPDERWYQISDGKMISQENFYPSVTWIASFYPKSFRYMRWLADKGWDKAEEIKNEAAEKGSRVHHACDNLLRGVEIKIDSKYPNNEGEEAELTAEEYGIVMTFRQFLEDEQPIVLASDYTLVNHKERYAGTLDMKCRIKSDEYKSIHIIDIKTSSDIWPSHEIQVSAYKHADPECEKIDILQVGYKRNKQGYKLTEIEDQFDVFLSVKRIWQKESEGVQVPQKDYPLSLKWNPKKVEKITKKKVIVRKKSKKQ